MLSGYHAFSRRYVKSFPATSRGFETETEMTIHALDLCIAFEDVPVSYGERPGASTSKLRTIPDGLRILRFVLLLCKDYRPIRFFGALTHCVSLGAARRRTCPRPPSGMGGQARSRSRAGLPRGLLPRRRSPHRLDQPEPTARSSGSSSSPFRRSPTRQCAQLPRRPAWTAWLGDRMQTLPQHDMRRHLRVATNGLRRVMLVGPGQRFLSGITAYTFALANTLAAESELSVLLMRRLLPRRLYPGAKRVGSPLTSTTLPCNVPVFDGVDYYWMPSILRASVSSAGSDPMCSSSSGGRAPYCTRISRSRWSRAGWHEGRRRVPRGARSGRTVSQILLCVRAAVQPSALRRSRRIRGAQRVRPRHS